MSSTARSAVFAPLADGNRTETVVRRLNEAIALGLLADGEQLPSENELAAQLNVSTVTLREALATLRQRGLLRTRRGRYGGSFAQAPGDQSTSRLRQRLRELTAHELRESGDHHGAFGGAAARLAALRCSADNIERLEDTVDQLATAETPAARRRADSRFHIEIAAASQSARLTRAEVDLQAEIGELLWLPHAEAIEAAEALRQHRDILQAIAAGEADRARALIEAHIEQGITQLIDYHMRMTAR